MCHRDEGKIGIPMTEGRNQEENKEREARPVIGIEKKLEFR